MAWDAVHLQHIAVWSRHAVLLQRVARLHSSSHRPQNIVSLSIGDTSSSPVAAVPREDKLVNRMKRWQV